MRENIWPGKAWQAGVAASMVIGLLWLLGLPIGRPGGLLGGPETPQAWFAPGSADPSVPPLSIALNEVSSLTP